MGQVFSGGGSRPATAEELQSIETMRQSMAQLPVPVLQHRNNPHEYLFFALFDGTGQDLNNPKLGLPTNVGTLNRQAELLERNPDNRIGVHYSKGIGSQDNGLTRALDGALALTWDDGIEKMYREFAKQSSEWQRNDPQAQIRVAGVGYSRGAVQEAGFLRLVDKYGIANPKDLTFGRDEHGNITVKSPHPPLVPPGQVVQVAALFDPVATNMPDNYDARLPPSVISSVSILAANEQRELFPHQAINAPGMTPDGRALNVPAPGGHSNIGGGNKEAGVEIMVGNAMMDYLNRLREEPLFDKRPVPDDLTKMTVFQARGATAAFGLKMDDDGVRNLREELANCKIVDPCRSSEPMNRELANQFQYRTGSVDAAEQAQLRALIAQVPEPARDALQADSNPALQQQWQQQRQLQQLQPLQREEQRHTSTIQAASEQKEVAQATLGSGLRMSDPDHPAYDNYEQARRAVVEMYSHQRKDVDERIEPMAASMVAQAQRDGLAHINDVKPSPDGQQLIASNTRDLNADHRETAQLPMAQAANQSVEESSRQWATHQIAQAQERIQEHTQARANVQERMQAQTQEFARAHTATLERAPTPAYTQAPQPQERAPIQAFTPAVESQVAAPTLTAGIDTRMPQQAPQMQPQPYIPAPEHAPSHTFAPAQEPQVAAPAMTADSDMQVQIQLAAQQAQQLAQQMLLQQQHIAELERQLQDRRGQEERRDAERRDDQYREARQPDAQQHDDPMQRQATASGYTLDPRHPQHPDHALYQGIHDKVAALYDKHGVVRSDEQVERIVAAMTVDAKIYRIKEAVAVSVSHDGDTPDFNHALAVYNQYPPIEGSRCAITMVSDAMKTPMDASFQKLDQVTQQLQEQEQQWRQQREQANTQEQGPLTTR